MAIISKVIVMGRSMLYVIALGGNALVESKVLSKLAKQIIKLHARGNQILITHGNGPQVGELALREKKNLALLTEETEIQMGEKLERALLAAAKNKQNTKVVIALSRFVVNKKDKDFQNPSKPIGRFYDETEAAQLRKKGFVMKKLLGGYRRVVPSPRPEQIPELQRIRRLLSEHTIVIAAGGGGIPVTKEKGKLKYADAVIDKDLTSSLLAARLNANRLFILTNVDGVFIGYGSRNSHMLRKVDVSDLQNYVRQVQFEAGSMLPKVEACINFVKKTGNRAVIGNLNNAEKVFAMKNGTIISA